MRKSDIIFDKNWPSLKDTDHSLLIYDSKLSRSAQPIIRQFKFGIKVKAGESLKEIEEFSKIANKVAKASAGFPVTKIRIVGLGGGSVGDFCGFLASVYKRGVRLTLIPSTWLSAIDSAHGGKTALNLGQFKNQIGSFYPAEQVRIVRPLLLSQPNQRLIECQGEIFKMALLAGGSLGKIIGLEQLDQKKIWSYLPILIQEKWKIVSKDPYEKKSIRFILNLGHTVGHVLERELKLPHGVAILYGLKFALEWSFQRGLLSEEPTFPFLPGSEKLAFLLRKVKNPERSLMQDKKMSAVSSIKFIFLKKMGQPIVLQVTIAEILQEWRRQAFANV